MRQDITAALRSLRHTPGLTLAALAILTLGIGAATTVFSVVDAVVLRGLPFDDAGRLVAVREYDTKSSTTFGAGRTTAQTYLDWRARQQVFSGIAAGREVVSTSGPAPRARAKPADAVVPADAPFVAVLAEPLLVFIPK